MPFEHQSRILGMALLVGEVSFRTLESVLQDLVARGWDSDPEALLEELRQRGVLGEEALLSLRGQVADLERLMEEDRPDPEGRKTSEMKAPDRRDLRTVPQVAPAVLGDRQTPSRIPETDTLLPEAYAHLERQVLSVLTLPRWNQYINLKFIGEGGMGRIFRAYDPLLNRPVALKFLRQVDSATVHGLIEEARNQALADHPNICKVYEIKEWRGQVYVAMQFIEGRTLDHVARQLDTLQKVELLEQVAEAVHAAHRHGLIHRDLKPANIMVQQSPEGALHPFVLDFGLARDTAKGGHTQQGSILGTAHYMAPEQARGDNARIDRRTDVYALGVTLYELLTGAPPFNDQEGVDCLLCIIKSEVPPPRSIDPGIHPDLQTLVMKCLEKDPEQRYGSARALAEDLRRFRDGEPILARPPTWAYRFGKFARRNRPLVILAGSALLVVLVIAGFGLQARRTAASRAYWAQHFGQESERIEALLRYARLQPVHDLREELEAVRSRIQSIETQMRGSGGQTLGPGHYALGRAFLALGDIEQATAHLDRAWDSGFQVRDVAYARGRALGQVYAKALEKARLLQDPVLRESRIRDLEETLREPAVELLRRGRGSLLDPHRFQEGLLAFYDRRWNEALMLADEAVGSAPWFYEARSLQASVYLDRARLERDPVQALAALDEAGRALDAAAHTGPSDPGLRSLQARRWWEEMILRRRAGRDSGKAAEAFKASCAAWKSLLPDSPDPDARLAWGEIELAKLPGASPQALQAAIHRAEGIVQANPNHQEALGALAAGLQLQAYDELNHGRDPRPGLDRAIGLLRHALKADVPAFELFEPYAAALWARVEYEKSRGRDPSSTVQEALSSIQNLAIRYPRVADIEGFLGGIQVELADYQATHGVDPEPVLRNALTRLGRASQKVPSRHEFHFGQGNAHLVHAQYLFLTEQAPAAALDAAERAYRKALECNASAPGPVFGLGETGLLRAQLLAARNQVPLEALAAAESAMATLKDSRSNWRSLLFKAQADLLHAGWPADPKTSRGFLAAAERAAEQAVQRSGKLPAALVVAAQVQFGGARLFPGEGRARIDRSKRYLQEALRQDAGFVPARRLEHSLGLERKP